MACDLGMVRRRHGPHIGLLLETTCVSVGVVGLLGLLAHLGSGAGRAGPWVLILGALLPTLARGRNICELGFRLGRVRQGVLWLGISSALLLVLGVIGIAIFHRLSIKPPLSAAVPKDQWRAWVLFQFGFVALPEELFFRGYFLTNSMTLLRAALKGRPSTVEAAGVCLSAGVFAISHVLVLGSAASLLTFFPGLIFGWLFIRMASLIPSVLLHGAANIGYVLMLRGVM